MDPLAIVAILGGTIATLVSVIGFLFRQVIAGYDRRIEHLEAELAAALTNAVDARQERNIWRDRSIQTDRRLDRVAGVIVAPAEAPVE